MTTVVVARTSARVGVTTFRISPRTSFRNSRVRTKSAVTRFGWLLAVGETAAFAMDFFSATGIALLLGVHSWSAATSSSNSGRGGGIRTPKFGFGDRQFNR